MRMSLNIIILKNFLFLLIFSTFSVSLLSFQGILQPSFGARQAGMGGAFQAVGDSVMDLESNPSHLGRLKNSKLEFGTSFHSAKISYEDEFRNSNPSLAYKNNITENPKAVLPYVGYITPLSSRLGAGIALYSQGGGGGKFHGIQRLMPNGKTLNQTFGVDIPYIGEERKILENVEFKFMTVKSTFGVGFKMRNLSIGAGLDLVYGFMEMKRTYYEPTCQIEIPGGFRYISDPAYSHGGKIGLSYDVNSKIRIAYSYVTRNLLPLDGRMSVNTSLPDRMFATGVSRFMIWPDKHTAGISYQADNWLFAFDVKFIPWSQSFRTSKFILENAWMQTPTGMETNTFQFNLNWKDQTILALGFEYKWNESFRTRTGYSYGKTPMRERGVSPMLGGTTEHHLACGMGYYLEKIAIQLALEYGFPNKVRGARNSDWTISHSMFPTREIRPFDFDHSKTMSVMSIYLGIETLL